MKNILYTALLILACIPLKAQLRIHSNFGIKAGAQVAKLGQPATNWDSKYRWHAGFLAHLHISVLAGFSYLTKVGLGFDAAGVFYQFNNK